jgi:hypothetical protein
MIQRIQSLWFLLASIASVLIFFYPVIELNAESKLFIWEFKSISIGGIDNLIQSGFIIAGLTLIIAFLSFLCIFLYKKRVLQIRISTVISLLVIFTTALIGIFTFSLNENEIVSLGLSSILPLIVFILIMMARRAVKKDEQLVRSVDRIR